MNDKKRKRRPSLGIESSILDGIRQWRFPPEFRIAVPDTPLEALEMVEAEMQRAPVAQRVERPAGPTESSASNELVADLANCLWYLKTKHFNRKWEDDDTGDDDPRVRRALGRLSKGIDALKESGVEIQDPTNKRYPQGGEGMMRPIQFEPTAGLTVEKVTETVVPIIYRDDRLIQRGEVFVAVPQEAPSPTADQAADSAKVEATVSAPSEPASSSDEAGPATDVVVAASDAEPGTPPAEESNSTPDEAVAELASQAEVTAAEPVQSNRENKDELSDEQAKSFSAREPDPEQDGDADATDSDEETETNKG